MNKTDENNNANESNRSNNNQQTIVIKVEDNSENSDDSESNLTDDTSVQDLIRQNNSNRINFLSVDSAYKKQLILIYRVGPQYLIM